MSLKDEKHSSTQTLMASSSSELDDVDLNDLIWQSIANNSSESFKRKSSKEFAITFKNGNKYQGQMQAQQLHGKGKYVWTDGTVYEGDFTNNSIHGRGSFVFSDEKRYSGTLQCGLFHGNGYLVTEHFTYSGEFRFGMQHGRGIVWNAEGHPKFDGHFENGKQVVGRKRFADGIFEGTLDKNESRKNGKFYFFKNHNSFTGSWVADKKHGPGLLEFDGQKIYANWSKDTKEGPGLCVAKNDDVFVSKTMFENDLFKNAFKVNIDEDSSCLLREVFRLFKTGNTENFTLLIEKITEQYGAADLSKICPLHLASYKIDIHSTPIMPFIGQVLPEVPTEAIISLESKSLHLTITNQLVVLQNIYQKYASEEITSTFMMDERKMTRLHLWQFMLDLNLDVFEINAQESLSEIEKEFNILTAAPNDSTVEIGFAQFLKYLLGLTLKLHRIEKFQNIAMQARPPAFGLFSTMFLIFLREFLVPVEPFSKGILAGIARRERAGVFNKLGSFLRDVPFYLDVGCIFKFVWNCKKKKSFQKLKPSNLNLQDLFQDRGTLKAIPMFESKTQHFFEFTENSDIWTILLQKWPYLTKTTASDFTIFHRKLTVLEIFEMIFFVCQENLKVRNTFQAEQQSLKATSVAETAKKSTAKPLKRPKKTAKK